jgi:hypothetical protein
VSTSPPPIPPTIPPRRAVFTSPVIDYEPPPAGAATPCPPLSPAALRRRTPRPLRPVPHLPGQDPPTAVAAFAEAALRRVLEVVDRRRPIAQVRPLLDPALIDSVTALTRSRHAATATLRRVRLRTDSVDPVAAEVFATFSRGPRVHAIAARVEFVPRAKRWRLVALQIG